MEILITGGSFVFALLVTVLSIKLAAGWLDAEHNGWGRCIGALLLAYLVAVTAAGLGFVVAAMIPETMGLIVLIVAIIISIIAPIFVFARVLGTSGLRAFAILLIAAVVNVAIWIGIAFVLAMVLGVGLAGLSALFGAGAMVPDMDGGDVDGSALERFERGVEQLCECTDAECVSARVAPLEVDLMAAMEGIATTDDPNYETHLEALFERMAQCEQLDSTEPPKSDPATLTIGPCLSQLAPDELAAYAEMEMESGIPAEQLCGELSEDFVPDAERAPTPAQTPSAAPSFSYYALRDIAIADAAAHIGKLVRVTLADGSRRRDQLVAFDGGSVTLKRDKSEGGGRYSIAVTDIVRMEVFDR